LKTAQVGPPRRGQVQVDDERLAVCCLSYELLCHPQKTLRSWFTATSKRLSFPFQFPALSSKRSTMKRQRRQKRRLVCKPKRLTDYIIYEYEYEADRQVPYEYVGQALIFFMGTLGSSPSWTSREVFPQILISPTRRTASCS
jgi:hypothetical protein